MTQTTMYDYLTRPITQTEKVLHKLKQAGLAGVTNYDLNQICFRYGARIHELREQGHDIKTIQIKRGYFRFILVSHD